MGESPRPSEKGPSVETRASRRARVDDEEPFSAGRNERIAGVERYDQGMESTEESAVENSIVT